jgi:hypothetical protein
VGRAVAAVVAIVFINGSWFGLHFSEGHIAFGTMQLLPLSIALAMTANHRRNLVALGLLEAFFLLDGSIYTFVYSLLAILTAVALGMVRPKVLRAALTQNPQQLVLLAVATMLLAMPKVLPVIWGVGDRTPEIDTYAMPLSLVARSLFNPFEIVHSTLPPDAHTRFEILEFNCYLSVFGLLIIAMGGFRPRLYWRHAWPYLVGALVWFWVGSGWWPRWNPWRLIQLVPLVNNVHVQSRLLLLMYIFFVILLAKALQHHWQHRAFFWVVSAILIVESVVVRNFPMTDPVTQSEPSPTKLIDHTTFTNAIAWAYMPSHYFTGYGSRECYEPSFYPSNIKIPSNGNYQGEAYPVEKDAGTARISEYTPGHIVLEFDLKRISRIELNSNALNGWRVDPRLGKLTGSAGDLLQFEPKMLSGTVDFWYWPPYMPWIAASYVAGALMFVWLWRATRRKYVGSPL